MGTKQQAFIFTITIHSIQMSLPIPVRLGVIWRRRNKRIKTEHRPLSPSVGSVEFGEELSMVNTLYQVKSGSFQRKKALLTVQAYIENKDPKKVGQLSLNLSDYTTSRLTNRIFPLEGGPDSKAIICISIEGSPSNALVSGEAESQPSEFSEFSMGTYGVLTNPEQDLSGFDYERIPKLPEIKKNRNTLSDISEEDTCKKAKDLLLEEVENLKKEIATLNEKARTDKETMKEHMTRLDQDYLDLTKRLAKSQERVKRRDAKIESLKSANSLIIKDLKNVELQLNSYSAVNLELDQLKDEIKRLQSENTSLKATIEDLGVDLTSDTKDKSKDKTIEDYKRKTSVLISNLTEQISSLEKALEESKKQREEQSSVLHQLRADLIKVEEESARRINLRDEEILESKKMIEYMRQNSKDDSLVCKVKKLKEKLHRNREETIKHKEKTNNLQEEIENLKSENRKLSSQHAYEAVVNMQEQDLQQELKIAKMETEDLHKKLTTAAHDYSVMEKKYVDAKMTWANADMEKEELNFKLKDALLKLQESSADFTAIEVELYKLNDRYAHSVNLNNELEAKIQSLESKLSNH